MKLFLLIVLILCVANILTTAEKLARDQVPIIPPFLMREMLLARIAVFAIFAVWAAVLLGHGAR